MASNDPAAFQEFREALGTRDPKTIATYLATMRHQELERDSESAYVFTSQRAAWLREQEREDSSLRARY